jgi:hypothetical protein
MTLSLQHFVKIVVCLFIFTCLKACSTFPCEDEVLSSAKSPNEKYSAIFFERGCGATVPFYRGVAITAAGDEKSLSDRHQWILYIEGQPRVSLSWASPTHLKVHLDGSSSPVLQVIRLGEFFISYE